MRRKSGEKKPDEILEPLPQRHQGHKETFKKRWKTHKRPTRNDI
jgi:hypothetical protein